jgi:hypothetical protein
VPIFGSGLRWGPERMTLSRLDDIRPGFVLCPVEWEVAYRSGDRRVEPWAVAIHRPITVRVLQPGHPTWKLETKISIVCGDERILYYAGAPTDLVRIIIPARHRTPDVPAT